MRNDTPDNNTSSTDDSLSFREIVLLLRSHFAEYRRKWLWVAGGGIQGGLSHGETDDYSYNIIRDPVPIHDLNATILHCLGINHERLTYRYQGRDFRLTDVQGNVVKDVLV